MFPYQIKSSHTTGRSNKYLLYYGAIYTRVQVIPDMITFVFRFSISPLKPSIVRNEEISISSPLLTPLMDFGEPEEKRTRRKPNFTVQERMHLAQSYVESYEEYNRASHL